MLLSYAKIVLFDEIVASDLPDDPYLPTTLRDYFPAKMHKAHASDINEHRLRREIIATVLANDVINRGGPGFRQHADRPDGLHAGRRGQGRGADPRRLRPDSASMARSTHSTTSSAARCRTSSTRNAARLRHRHRTDAQDQGDAGAARRGDRAAAEALQKLKSGSCKARFQRMQRPRSRRQRAAYFIERGVPPALAEEIAALAVLDLRAGNHADRRRYRRDAGTARRRAILA